jgi:hypothetical protein
MVVQNNKVMELRSTTPLVDENPSREILRRGYSQLAPNGKASIKGPSIHTNVLIQKTLPARGVVSSNPKRVERLLTRASEEGLLTNVQEHTNVGWGVTIYTATFGDVPIFVAGVPMGAAGSGFAFFEMFAAGAQAVSCLQADRVAVSPGNVGHSKLCVLRVSTSIQVLLVVTATYLLVRYSLHCCDYFTDYSIWQQRPTSDDGEPA